MSLRLLTQTILTVLHDRYEFQPHGYDINVADGPSLKKMTVFRVLAEAVPEREFEGYLPTICSFVSCALRKKPLLQGCDLLSGNLRSFDPKAAPIVVQHSSVHEADSCYILQPRKQAESHGNTPARLVIKDFLIAAQVIRRRWGPEVKDVVLEFVQRGIPFEFRFDSNSSMPLKPASLVHVGLGT